MKKILRIIGAIVVALSAAYVYIVKNVVPDYIQQILPQVEQLVPEYINGSAKIGSIVWEGGLTAEIHDVELNDQQGRKVAVLPRTLLHFKPWLALEKPARALSGVELLRPQVYLTLGEDEKWNMQHLLKPSDSSETPFYGTLALKDAVLQLSMPQGTWQFGVDGTVNGAANPDFAISAKVQSGSDILDLQGQMTTKGDGSMQLKGSKLALQSFAPLAQHYAQIEELQGGLGKLSLVYNSKNGKQRFSGDVEIAALGGRVQAAGAKHDFVLDGKLTAHDNYLLVKGLDATIDKQKLHLEGEADLRDTDAISGSGVVTAAQLEYQGYAAKNLRIPFVGNKDEIIVHDAVLEYGGGKIAANGTYTIAEKNFIGDIEARNVTHTPDEAGNAVTVAGKIAVLAKALDEGVKVHAAADTFDLTWRNMKINRLALDGMLEGKNLRIDNFSAFAGAHGTFAARGLLAEDGSVRIHGRMADFPVDGIIDMATGNGGQGLVSMGFDIGGRADAPEFAGIVQLTRAEIMQQKIPEAHGFVSLKDNVLTLKEFIAHMQQGQHIVNGSVDFKGEEPYFDLAVDTENVRIEPLVALASPGVDVTGNLTNIVQVRGTKSKLYVNGEVHASDGSAAKQLFNAVDGRYAYENGTLHLSNFLIQAFAAKITLNGVMTSDQRMDFDMDAQNVNLAHLPINDDTVALTGYFNAKGHVGGTLTSPFFQGDVTSDKLSVNGETLTELSGTLNSNAKNLNELNVKFKQPYKDDPVNYGMFSAVGNLNLVEHFIKGDVLMMYGDIGGLLRMAKQDYDINGKMQGKLEFNPQGKGSGINLKLTSDDIKIHDLHYEHLNFDGRLQKGILSFNDVKLQEQAKVADKGIITVGGNINLKEKIYNVAVTSTQANPAIVTAVMKDPPEIKGRMDLLLQLQGKFDNPSGTGSLLIEEGSLAGVGMDSLTASLSLADDHINLEQLVALKDAYGVTAKGDIPLDIFRSKEQRRNPNAQMDIRMDLRQARLGILPAMTKMVEWAVGDTDGELRLAGTLEEPLLYGSLKVDDGNVKVKYLDTVLENIKLDVTFDGNMVNLRDFAVKMGKGSVTASGSYALHTDADVAYNLQVTASNAELASQLVNAKINADVAIKPQKYRDFRKKPNAPPNSMAKNQGPPPEQYRPQFTGEVKIDDVLVNMPTIPELGEGESNYGLDLAIKLGNKVHLYNSYLYDLWLSGAINLKGSTVFPIIEGTIKADKGEIKYLRTDFKLKHASLSWVDVGSWLPNVTLDSQARFSRYNIFMKINGPVSDNMEMQLTSNPPLERNTIVRMLTLQRDTAGSNDVTGEDVSNLMTAGLQMTVLGDVEMFVKQNLGLDQFRIYSGKVRTGIGFESTKDRSSELTNDEKNQYNVVVSKYLTNAFMVGYTTSFDSLHKSAFAQVDVSRHFNLSYSRSQEMSNKNENWYGLEYQVSF